MKISQMDIAVNHSDSDTMTHRKLRPHNRRFRMIIPSYPAFNIYSRIARSTTALGPLCVSSVVAQMPGWDVEVIDENNYRSFGPKDSQGLPDHATIETIRNADVVGLYGGLSSTIPRLFDIAQFYKEQGITTIAGGQHFVGDTIRVALENGCDYVVRGEGEYTIKELLRVLEKGDDPVNVAGIAFVRDGAVVMTEERPPITCFDDLPLPNFDLIRYAKVSLYPVGWIRGCGMNCEFCTVKGKPRAAAPERVLAQIAHVVEARRARHFFIVDDLFGHNRGESLHLCALLKKYQKAVGRRLDITVQIRLDFARDEELLRAMREAGVNAVCIGFESPIPDELSAMDKRTKPEEMRKMTHLYHRAGFLVHGMFIFGYPLPKGSAVTLSLKERIRSFRTFIRKSRLDTIQVLLPVPLPGTELTKRLAADNRIFPLAHIGWEYYDGNFPLFMPDPPMTPENMQMAIREIMGRFYRFRNMFYIARNVLVFPAMIFSLWNIRCGWSKWYRTWRQKILRFGGWIIFRRWIWAFRRGTFSQRLIQAKDELMQSGTQRKT